MEEILIACERSGRVRDALIKLGYDAISCDLFPSDTPGAHYQGDVRDLLKENFKKIIAFPDCTYLTNSGVQWLFKDPSRWEKLDAAAEFFKLFLNHPCKNIAIENPIMHKYARERIGNIKYSQIIQPWQFGHTERKATCLWLKGFPLLKETNNVREEMLKLPKNQQQKVFFMPPSPERARLRGKTYLGVAEAMAQQWGHIE